MEKHARKKFKSETRVITCRVVDCKAELLAKNYRQHLIDRHPNESPLDLSSYGQQKLNFGTYQKQTSGKKRSTDQELVSAELSKQQKTTAITTDYASAAIYQPSHIVPFTVSARECTTSADVGAEEESLPHKDSCIATERFNEVVSNINLIKESIVKIEESVRKKPKPTEPNVMGDEKETLLAKVTLARSIKDIEAAGFSFDREKKELSCSVCSDSVEFSEKTSTGGVFRYDEALGLGFGPEENLPEAFRNLKKHVKRHIQQSRGHIESLLTQAERLKEAKKRKTKNYEAGMNLGRLCYKLYLKGRPFSDYEDDVLILKQANANVGELNHSRKFPPAFLLHITKEVKSRMKKFLSGKMEQTGHRPPLALSADKATYKHRSRQFLGGVTISPGGKNLLEVISFGQPVVKYGSNAVALADNMKEGFDEMGVDGCQIESTVFDGVYFHIGIKSPFDSLYGLQAGDILYSYDALHKAGLVDTHLCKMETFKWLVQNTDVCQQIFTLFNWGANYEKLVAATALWKLQMKSLVGFSETRFANSRRQVYINIHHEFPAIITCLENQILQAVRNKEGSEPADYKLREKGDKARELKGKILNAHFLLNLSGLADVYGQFGVVVNTAQMVHLLPHERYELFLKAVDQFGKMCQCLDDHSKCGSFTCPGQNCLWPLNHADKMTLIEKNEIRGIPVIEDHGRQAAGLQSETRHQREQRRIQKGADPVKRSDAQLLPLVTELLRGLKDEVFDEKSVNIIKMTKVVLDLPSLATKLHQPDGGYIKTSIVEFPNFMDAVKKIPLRSVASLPPNELKHQHKEFLKRLEKLTANFKKDDLKKTDPKAIIKKFFDPSNNLFQDIEMIMQALATAAVKQSCESILESMVSRYENHFSSDRNMAEDNINDEFFVAVNGPSLGHCDKVVEKAMNQYWKSKQQPEWHFYRTTVLEQLKDYDGDSKVLHKLLNTESHFKFME